MKMIKTTVACGLLAASTFASAEHLGGSLSANVALTSDYVWRGVSQTDRDPAIQGGFDFAHDSGVYAGIWASNVEEAFLGASAEIDTYIGYSTEIAGIGVDAGFLHYEYPGATGETNIDEVYVGVSYGPVSVTYYEGVDVLNDVSDFGSYLDISAEFELPYGLGLGLHAGQYDLKGGAADYWDWKVAVSKEISGVTVEVAYTDTDDAALGDLDDSQVVLTVSTSL